MIPDDVNAVAVDEGRGGGHPAAAESLDGADGSVERGSKYAGSEDECKQWNQEQRVWHFPRAFFLVSIMSMMLFYLSDLAIVHLGDGISRIMHHLSVLFKNRYPLV